MISWLLKIKKNKVLFSLVIALAVVCVFDLVAIVVNVVQMVKVGANTASLFGGFLPFNIAVIVVNALTIAAIVVYVILKRFTKLKV